MHRSLEPYSVDQRIYSKVFVALQPANGCPLCGPWAKGCHVADIRWRRAVTHGPRLCCPSNIDGNLGWRGERTKHLWQSMRYGCLKMCLKRVSNNGHKQLRLTTSHLYIYQLSLGRALFLAHEISISSTDFSGNSNMIELRGIVQTLCTTRD